jgi:hypothetical protein
MVSGMMSVHARSSGPRDRGGRAVDGMVVRRPHLRGARRISALAVRASPPRGAPTPHIQAGIWRRELAPAVLRCDCPDRDPHDHAPARRVGRRTRLVRHAAPPSLLAGRRRRLAALLADPLRTARHRADVARHRHRLRAHRLRSHGPREHGAAHRRTRRVPAAVHVSRLAGQQRRAGDDDGRVHGVGNGDDRAARSTRSASCRRSPS